MNVANTILRPSILGRQAITHLLKPKRFLKRKSIRDAEAKVYGPEVHHPPFPYHRKPYNIWTSCYDGTSKRLNEHSKVIAVEGQLASGKTDLAKYLAKEFDFVYFPEANQDMYYINSYGYDLRQLDCQIPKSCRTLDINNFLLQPTSTICAQFQFKQLQIKFHQYMDAMAHLLNTGQGVVLQRVAYSDLVFINAMYNEKLISKKIKEAYYKLSSLCLPQLFYPHVYIYLHVPVEKTIENIKERDFPHEVNSRVLTPSFLKSIENSYKLQFLKEQSKYCEVLIYDWTDGMPDDCEFILEDIERMDLEHSQTSVYTDFMFPHWRQSDPEELNESRIRYTSQKNRMLQYSYWTFNDIDEFFIDGYDIFETDKIYDEAPGQKFMEGFNQNMGDSLWDMWTGKAAHKANLFLLPKRERRTYFPPILP